MFSSAALCVVKISLGHTEPPACVSLVSPEQDHQLNARNVKLARILDDYKEKYPALTAHYFLHMASLHDPS